VRVVRDWLLRTSRIHDTVRFASPDSTYVGWEKRFVKGTLRISLSRGLNEIKVETWWLMALDNLATQLPWRTFALCCPVWDTTVLSFLSTLAKEEALRLLLKGE
jgi:hypothetical protein